MENCRSAQLSMSPHWQPKDGDSIDITEYQKHTEQLNWLAIKTRPDISFTLTKLQQCTGSPNRHDLDAVMQIYRYPKANPNLLLTFGKSTSKLQGYVLPGIIPNNLFGYFAWFCSQYAPNHVNRVNRSGVSSSIFFFWVPFIDTVYPFKHTINSCHVRSIDWTRALDLPLFYNKSNIIDHNYTSSPWRKYRPWFGTYAVV